jgi:hypothetical protein
VDDIFCEHCGVAFSPDLEPDPVVALYDERTGETMLVIAPDGLCSDCRREDRP